MWRGFWHLCARAWSVLLTSLGTTTLSIIVFSIIAPIAVFFVSFYANRRRGEKPVSPLTKAALKESVMPTLITVGVVLVLLGAIFGVSVVRTIYADHSQLVSERDTFIAANLDYGRQNIELTKDLASTRAEIERLKKQTAVRPSGTPTRVLHLIQQLTDKGSEIQQTWVADNNDAGIAVAYAKWVVESKRLLASVDPSFVVQFENAHGAASMGCPFNHSINGCGYWADIAGKKNMLMAMLTEVRQAH